MQHYAGTGSHRLDIRLIYLMFLLNS